MSSRRTTLILDEESQQQLEALSSEFGSQTAAVRQAISGAHAALDRRRRRRQLIDWLIEHGGEPSEEDREWARRIAMDVAAAREALR